MPWTFYLGNWGPVRRHFFYIMHAKQWDTLLSFHDCLRINTFFHNFSLSWRKFPVFCTNCLPEFSLIKLTYLLNLWEENALQFQIWKQMEQTFSLEMSVQSTHTNIPRDSGSQGSRLSCFWSSKHAHLCLYICPSHAVKFPLPPARQG